MTNHEEKRGDKDQLQKLEWALEWLDQHGLQTLTQATVTESGWNIGWWIDYQRRLAPRDTVIQEKLDEAYPDWREVQVSTTGPRAKNRAQQLVDYVKRNGGAFPTIREKEEDGFAVGNYLRIMRERYNREPETIRAETIDLFNREIPGWSEPRRKDRIRQLIDWVKRNDGKLPAPKQEDADGYMVGHRMTDLQKKGRNGLRAHTVDILDKEIPNWENPDDRLDTVL